MNDRYRLAGRRVTVVSCAAATLLLGACASSATAVKTPEPDVTVSVPAFTPAATPTIVDPGAGQKPSTGGVLLAPTASGPLSGHTIAIDPGHNHTYVHAINDKLVPYFGAGSRPCQQVGSTAMDKKTTEAALTWDIGVKTSDALRAQGATVALTRPDNNGTGPCNDERARIADKYNADMLISIHADGNANAKNRGFVVIWSNRMKGGGTLPAQSKALAGDIVAELDKYTEIPVSNYVGANGIFERDNELGQLNTRENGPAVLLEVGNLIQADDWAILATDEGRQTIAQGLVAAASDSIVRPDPTTSPSPTPTKK